MSYSGKFKIWKSIFHICDNIYISYCNEQISTSDEDETANEDTSLTSNTNLFPIAIIQLTKVTGMQCAKAKKTTTLTT